MRTVRLQVACSAVLVTELTHLQSPLVACQQCYALLTRWAVKRSRLPDASAFAMFSVGGACSCVLDKCNIEVVHA